MNSVEPDAIDNNTTNKNKDTEQIEGLDIPPDSSGWGDYPLDSVFVRKEQRTVGEVVRRIKANRYILNPDFQRDFVWPTKKQSRLIESCLMRIPLPVFYVAEAKDGRIIVVDGLQRLTTFTKFLSNEFALKQLGDGGEVPPQENPLLDKHFKDLPLNFQERIEDTQLTLYILDSKAPDRAKLDIFERVNSGEPLTRQQMRNSLFSGPATKWLKDAATNQAFVNATDGSLDKKSMRDREAINRFCAFRILGVEQYNSDMDEFLSRALDAMNGLEKQELTDLSDVFIKSMEANFLIFDRHAFRRSLEYTPPGSQTVINIALFDVCSVFFANIPKSFIIENKNELQNTVIELLRDTHFHRAITYATNGLKQVRVRFEMMEEALKKVTSIC